jgi:hypothetical protein
MLYMTVLMIFLFLFLSPSLFSLVSASVSLEGVLGFALGLYFGGLIWGFGLGV